MGSAFVCTGFKSDTQYSNGTEHTNYSDDEHYSFVVNLERNVASFGYSIATGAGDNIPITKITDSYIWVQNQMLTDPYWEGDLNRYTGELHLFHRYKLGGDTQDFY